MGFTRGSITTTIQLTNTNITYISNTHLTQKTPLKQTKKNKSAHKATQTVNDVLHPMSTV
jgi:hypothetical protein